MGIQIAGQTLEEKAEKEHAQTKGRIRNLAIVCAVVLIARFVIKDPPAYVPPQHQNVTIKYLPGMLDAMDETTRSSLTEEQIKKFKEADLAAAAGSTPKEDEWTTEVYTAAAPVEAIQEDVEAYKEQVYKFAKRQEIMQKERERFEQLEIDTTKKTLVMFRRVAI